MIDYRNYDAIEIFQLGNTGDCLYLASGVAEIKKVYPHLDVFWTVAEPYQHVPALYLPRANIRVLPFSRVEGRLDKLWEATESIIVGNVISQHSRKTVLHLCTQIWPNNLKAFDGTVRTSVLRGLCFEQDFKGVSLEFPIEARTIANLDDILCSFNIKSRPPKIVFVESAYTSGQSVMDSSFFLEAMRRLSKEDLAQILFLDLSGALCVEDENIKVIDVSHLSLREIHDLLPQSDCFIGVGSGLSVLATFSTNFHKPNIQVIRGDQGYFASMYQEALHAEIASENVIELAGVKPEFLADTIMTALFLDEKPAPSHVKEDFSFYIDLIETWALRRGRYLDAIMSIEQVLRRFGPITSVTSFMKKSVLKKVVKDPYFNFLVAAQALQNVERFK